MKEEGKQHPYGTVGRSHPGAISRVLYGVGTYSTCITVTSTKQRRGNRTLARDNDSPFHTSSCRGITLSDGAYTIAKDSADQTLQQIVKKRVLTSRCTVGHHPCAIIRFCAPLGEIVLQSLLASSSSPQIRILYSC